MAAGPGGARPTVRRRDAARRPAHRGSAQRVTELFALHAEVERDVVGPLDACPEGPVPDRHFVELARTWLDDLLYDLTPVNLGDWSDEGQARLLATLQAWFAGPGRQRLRRSDAGDLADLAGLLTVPYPERLDAYEGQLG